MGVGGMKRKTNIVQVQVQQGNVIMTTKSRYYNGDPGDDHIPEDIGDTERDEIEIIRAICIKVQDFFISLFQC
jgi:hypothetical protein